MNSAPTAVILALALALLPAAQPIDPELLPTPPPRITPLSPRDADLLFAEAQEDFVRSATGATQWTDVLSPTEVRILRRLGCPHYDCRADAHEHLAELPDKGLRVILWGRHAKDAETREYCRGQWAALFRCARCGGSGEPLMDETWRDLCQDCCGTGDTREDCVYLDGVGYTRVARPLATVETVPPLPSREPTWP